MVTYILENKFLLSFVVDGGLSDWTTWADCAGTCNGTDSVEKRTRECTNPRPSFGGGDCLGATTEESTVGMLQCDVLKSLVQ